MEIKIGKAKEKANETRKLIFNSALKVFSKKGYSATTLEDIAVEAGISRGAIYWNFKNKQDLYVTLVKEYFSNNIHEGIVSKADQCTDPLEALKEYMYDYNSNVVFNNEIREFMELIRYKTEIKTLSNEVLQVQQEMDLIMKAEILKLVRNCIAAKQIRDDIDEEIIAMSILSYLNGIESTWMFNSDIFELEKHLRALLDLFLESICK